MIPFVKELSNSETKPIESPSEAICCATQQLLVVRQIERLAIHFVSQTIL
jgi:hypothetical protein